MSTQSLLYSRNNLIANMRALAESNPEMNAEDVLQLDRIYNRQAQMQAEIIQEAKHVKQFRNYLRKGSKSLELETIQNALQSDSDTKGGFLIMPKALANEVFTVMNNRVFIRQFATVMQEEEAGSLGVPVVETPVEQGDWTEELSTGSEDDEMTFGQRVLHPHPLSKRIKVSSRLLSTSPNLAETTIINQLGYKFAVTLENKYLNGTGHNQPLGLFVASTNGISTGRDVSQGNTATTVQPDNLKAVKYSLRSNFIQNGQWLFHRDVAKQFYTLKDGEGQYLLSEATLAGQPDLLLGRPLNLSEYAPNTMTTGQYVGIFGDFSQYGIYDSQAVSIQRINQLYAELNAVGFIGRYEGDGMPLIEDAFARVTLG